MCWIRLYHSFYHGTAGCWATSENISNFWGWKIPPTLLHLLCNSSQLPLEFHREVFLDLLAALNLAVVSVCLWHCGLVSYKWKHSQFLRLKKSGCTSSSPSTTIFKYNQNVLEDCFWTYLTLWIQLHSWFFCTSLGHCAASQNVSCWRVAENSENSKSDLKAVRSTVYVPDSHWQLLSI